MEKLKTLVSALLIGLTPDLVKEFIDGGLDALENKIAETETKIDDTLVSPLIKKIRELCNVPDNDTASSPQDGTQS